MCTFVWGRVSSLPALTYIIVNSLLVCVVFVSDDGHLKYTTSFGICYLYLYSQQPCLIKLVLPKIHLSCFLKFSPHVIFLLSYQVVNWWLENRKCMSVDSDWGCVSCWSAEEQEEVVEGTHCWERRERQTAAAAAGQEAGTVTACDIGTVITHDFGVHFSTIISYIIYTGWA